MIKAVNLIKANALNSKLFDDLCKESDYKLETLIALTCEMVSLLKKKKIQKFLHKTTAKQIMYKKFLDDHFLICLSFLVDIFESLPSTWPYKK